MKTGITFQTKYWGYPEDIYFGVYIVAIVNGRVIWESGWYETGYPDELNELRKEVQSKLDEWDYVGDLKSSNPHEWKIV